MKVDEPYLDLKQNPILGELRCNHYISIIYYRLIIFYTFLGQGFADIASSRYNWVVNAEATTASTDFVRSPPDVFYLLKTYFYVSNCRAIFHTVCF